MTTILWLFPPFFIELASIDGYHAIFIHLQLTVVDHAGHRDHSDEGKRNRNRSDNKSSTRWPEWTAKTGDLIFLSLTC